MIDYEQIAATLAASLLKSVEFGSRTQQVDTTLARAARHAVGVYQAVWRNSLNRLRIQAVDRLGLECGGANGRADLLHPLLRFLHALAGQAQRSGWSHH